MSAALDKKLRRKAARKARAQGMHIGHLGHAQQRAEQKFGIITECNKIISGKGYSIQEKAGAAKRKKAMTTDWQNRETVNLRNWYKPKKCKNSAVITIKP